MNSSSNFVIIGAGPKALAVVAKSFVLKKLFKMEIPSFHIIERNEIAGNWTGNNGFTNGCLRLGTSPQKDIGFPYQSDFFDDERDGLVNLEMRKFSWDSYLVVHGKYAEWIDRGRPNPKHCEWASYLRYGFSLVQDIVQIHRGELSKISKEQGLLNINYTYKSESKNILASSLMFTGPGEATTKIPTHAKRVFDINSYWKSTINFKKNEKVLIVGGGENSATIALDIHQRHACADVDINILTPSGNIISRGESYFENRVYTNAKHGHWQELTDEQKRAFIKHTDLGVYSVDAMNELSKNANLNLLRGLASKTTELKEKVIVEFKGNEQTQTYDKVIWANGFQKVGLLKSKLSELFRQELEKKFGEINDRNLEGKIGDDLSLSNLEPKLFLPMISGMNNGPGFSNLSSLGRLADKILSQIVKLKPIKKNDYFLMNRESNSETNSSVEVRL